ncbi:TonB-dependent receptor [Echinicola jeungdonensis]|uniref:TonB-dependent receptor domain-containing protein n=1 Tax=Echinicola jeungdonensis TaxID=709343 RepID=A0ABV5J8J9_9BACT|nr:TonB-dependent receptor [Echinicola jeungdonensis]MDN3669404.1 TonB-dependent receptor [Echinicola jeungdonensis]
MNKFLVAITLMVLAFLPESTMAQKGTIRGTIYDADLGDPLLGVSILVKETQTGGVTDLDGSFEIKLEPGVYSLVASFISFNKLEINNVEVKAGEVTLLDNLQMSEETAELESVVISAKAIRTTEAALMTVKRNSPNMMDGISAASFKKIGDSDAASAIKRVTGVSIEGGKYVYIRGLGDRYTKTILNGVDIPGLDPDRNSIQMDIFPTNVVDNIIVSKSFTSDLPADFTGGVVDIETKDFPEEKTFRVSASGGYNPSMHFNSDYLRVNGSSTDILGFDNGKRNIPTSGAANIPQYAEVVGNPNSPQGQKYQRILRGFDPVMGGYRQSNLMDMSLGLSFGNQVALGNNNLGYNVALTYSNETQFYEDAEFNLFAKPQNGNEYEMVPLENQKGDYGVNNVLLGGLAGLAFKTDLSKIKLNFLHLQNGESKVGQFAFINSNLGAEFEAEQFNIEYSERSLTNVLLNGTHSFGATNDWQLEWKVSPTKSKINDPDVRFSRFRKPGNTISTEVGLPERIWRNLNEDNLVGKFDFTKNLTVNESPAKLKFGASYAYKERDFLIQSFQFPTGNAEFTGDPNDIFNEENLFSENSRMGVRYNPTFIPNNPNEYNSVVNNLGLYINGEFEPFEKVKTILGVRMEKYEQFYTGTNQDQTIVMDNDKVLDDVDFFPTVNLIYSVAENQNLRFSYSKTIARPSFKELSFAEILDPITGRTFIGGLFKESTDGGSQELWDGNLTSTRINNFDARWEMFQKRGEIISVSAYYKMFDSPIEMVQYLSAPGSFQPRNVGDGTVAGMELELRKSLSIISPSAENFFFNANVTLAESKIDMSESELMSRKLTAREGENVKSTRDMAGQAPYIVNTGISYNGFEKGLEAGLFYNLQGPTLTYIGFGNRTDTYTVPFHSLNFNLNKFFGPEERIQTGFKVSNILGQERKEVFRSYNSEDKTFTRLNPGTKISVKFSYSF